MLFLNTEGISHSNSSTITTTIVPSTSRTTIATSTTQQYQETRRGKTKFFKNFVGKCFPKKERTFPDSCCDKFYGFIIRTSETLLHPATKLLTFTKILQFLFGVSEIHKI